MPKLYAGQMDVQGEGGADIVPLPDAGSVLVAADSGTIGTEIDARECDEAGTDTDKELTDHKVKEDEEPRRSTVLAGTTTKEESPGVISNAVADDNILTEEAGTVDTKISDDQVKEAEAGITSSDVLSDLAIQGEQGTINKELGITPSCCINEES